jgi:probable rRNA maturation factor
MPISVKTPASLAKLAAPLRSLVQSALELERRRAGEVGVVLADDALLRELNRDYRGLDKTTDVLSFAYDEGSEEILPIGPADPKRPVNGDLIVSMDRVREQAVRFGVSEGQELARLVVHGTLHLAGLDHQQPADRRQMRAREDEALAAAAATVRALEGAFGAPRAAKRRPA